MVEFTVDQSELKIPANSEAQIFSSDLFGSKAIQILRGDSSAYAVKWRHFNCQQSRRHYEAVRKELEPLRKKTDQLIAHVDEILSNEKAVFEDEATQGLPAAFKNLQRTVVTLRKHCCSV